MNTGKRNWLSLRGAGKACDAAIPVFQHAIISMLHVSKPGLPFFTPLA